MSLRVGDRVRIKNYSGFTKGEISSSPPKNLRLWASNHIDNSFIIFSTKGRGDLMFRLLHGDEVSPTHETWFTSSEIELIPKEWDE